MAKPPKDVTDAELAVLQQLWDRDGSTIRAIADALYPGGSSSDYATVQKLLERLEAKGYVGRGEPRGRAHTYVARIDRDALIAQQLQSTANKLCQGSLTPLLTHLVNGASLSRDELDELRALVDGASRKRPAQKKKSGRRR